MKYIYLIGLLFSHVSLIAGDNNDILQEIKGELEATEHEPEATEHEQPPVAPSNSYCNIEAQVSYLSSLQNRSDLQVEDVAPIIHHAYSQYRCSPTFTRLGGLTVLKNLAENYNIRLKFNPKKIPHALLQACLDKAVTYPVIILFGLGASVGLLINYSHEAMVKASVMVLNNATQLVPGWCDMCLQHWGYDAFTKDYRLHLYNQVALNCSELIDIVGQNISDIAESCSEGLHLWMDVSNKSFYNPICFGRGQVIGFEKCGMDDLKKHLQADATTKYINDHLYGIMTSGLAATCSFVGGCCVYGRTFVNGVQKKFGQCANNIKLVFNRCQSSPLENDSKPAQTNSSGQILLDEDEE